MNLYNILKQAHSGFRYIVFFLIVIAIIRAVADWLGKKSYTEGNRKWNLFTLISAHVQLLLGLVLYFLSPFVQFTSQTMKNAETRYWTMEHAVMMLFAIALITVGHSRAKKTVLHEGKFRVIAISYSLALLVIVVAILQSGRGLFATS